MRGDGVMLPMHEMYLAQKIEVVRIIINGAPRNVDNALMLPSEGDQALHWHALVPAFAADAHVSWIRNLVGKLFRSKQSRDTEDNTSLFAAT